MTPIGTEEQISRLVAEYSPMLLRLACTRLRDAADAEDAAQDVMLRLWQTDRTFEGDDHLRYFLVRVTLNVCKDISRSPWRRRTVPLESCREPSFSTPERQELFRAVLALPGKYRLPLYLCSCEGYSAREGGELLDLKPSTVQTRLARARTKLKEELEA